MTSKIVAGLAVFTLMTVGLAATDSRSMGDAATKDIVDTAARSRRLWPL